MVLPARAASWPTLRLHHIFCSSPSCQRQTLPRNRPPPRSLASSSDAPRRAGRHPELVQLSTSGVHSRNKSIDDVSSGAARQGSAEAGSGAVAVEQPRPEELDERYRRADYSDVFQFESRQAFTQCVAGGEPRMRLAEAALHVTAEDDAIASHSTVRFPVEAWMERIERLVDQMCRKDIRRAAAATSTTGGNSVDAEAEAVLRVTERYLFEEVGFRMPDYGRSNLPANSIVDHAGVWEDARLGYLHETLIRRMGHPAALGLLLGEVTTRLLARGVLPCAVAIDTRLYMLLPRAVPLPALTREVLLGAAETTAAPGLTGAAETLDVAGSGGGSSSSSNLAGLNTCTSEVLLEMLRHLKRCYWPFSWDTGVDALYPSAVGSHGGFRSAAKAAMGDDVSAALAAIGKVAAWRLERGIWTSPGAGDLRRARAACERLVLLAGELYPEERRDLAILLLHCGDVGAARLELRTYLNAVSELDNSNTSPSAFFKVSASSFSAEGRTASQARGLDAGSRQQGPDSFDLLLCRRLLEALESSNVSAVDEPAEPLGIESTLRAVPPWKLPASSNRRYMPLTW